MSFREAILSEVGCIEATRPTLLDSFVLCCHSLSVRSSMAGLTSSAWFPIVGKESLGREAEMSIFPTTILLATDGSEEAELARTTAMDEANSTNSELHVVTVGPWSPDPAYTVGEASFGRQTYTYEEVSEEIRKEAGEILDDQVRKIEEEGGSVQDA